MLAHHILDAIDGKSPRHTFIPSEGTEPDLVRTLRDGIACAEKFDFGSLLLEKAADTLDQASNRRLLMDGWTPEQWKIFERITVPSARDNPAFTDDVIKLSRNLFRLPDLTMEEKQFWIDGYIPLPAEVVWFEFILGEKRTGLLVTMDHDEADPTWAVMQVEPDGDSFRFDGVVQAIRPKRCLAWQDSWQMMTSGNPLLKGKHPEYSAGLVMLSIYLTLMLNSRSTERERVDAPAKLNKQRARRGYAPLPAHTIVRIVPPRWLKQAESDGLSERRSPRLHWRRTHLRHFDHETAGARWKADEVWKGRTGWYVTLIPRFMVARANPETVTHEYKVG